MTLTKSQHTRRVMNRQKYFSRLQTANALALNKHILVADHFVVSVSHVTSDTRSIVCVIFNGTPFEILDAVIIPRFVFVVNTRKIVRVWQERFRNQPVDVGDLSLSASGETD